MPPVRGMQPDDVFRLTFAGDPRISPDGSTVAYVAAYVDEEKQGRSAIWTVPVGGGTPRRATHAKGSDGSPRWSPDGRWLAFTSDRVGEVPQLYVMPADGPGEARKLTDLKEAVEGPVWSPDGTRIAFLARDHDPADDEKDVHKRPPRRLTRLFNRLDKEGWTQGRTRHVYVVGLEEGAEPVQITSGDFEDSSAVWSPHGDRLVFASSRHEDWDLSPVTDLYEVSSSGGDPVLLTKTDGTSDLPSFSPDGSRIAYVYAPGVLDEPHHGRIAVLDVVSKTSSILTASLDRTCAPYPPIRGPEWQGEDVVFPVEDRGRVVLYRAAADGSTPPAPVTDIDGWVTGFDVARETIAYAAATATSPPEIYVGESPITDVAAPFLSAVATAVPEAFTAVAPDGAEVDAWVIRPVGFEEGAKYPAVLNIHGGPYTQYGQRFFDEFQVEAGAGFVVIYANPRGSSGGTEAAARSIRGPVAEGRGWGSVDYDDLMSVVDEAVKRFDFIDADRLGVMGGSYGGYMTSWIVGHTDRFQCGISERAVNDLASEDGASDIAGVFKAYVGAAPWEAPDAYRAASPITYATNIETPLLILHSEEDLRCPIQQGEQLFTVLRSLKREVEFVRFPGESHELTRSGSPTHRAQRFEIVLDWLRRHLVD
jgi:dipeptidyl aminopeptidase/acylaminoacyl peptidase